MRASEFMSGPLRALCAIPLAVVLMACGGAEHRVDAPDAFRAYAEADDLRLITADGVRVAAREVDNEPVADLDFWVDAMKRHLDKRGYALAAEDCFTTKAGQKGCTLDFVLPNGAEDWVMSETIFVFGEKVVLVEAAGPFDRFQAVAPAYKQSLRSFTRKD